MIFLSEMFAAFITAMMLENLLFARAIDIPGLYEKRSPQQILLIGSILTTIIAVCSVPAYFINTLFTSHAAFVPYMTLSFLLLNCLVFLGFYFGIRRFAPAVFAQIGNALPFYGVNCATLGTLLPDSAPTSIFRPFSAIVWGRGSALPVRCSSSGPCASRCR